jgi:Protein of unknown function (DUF3106)
MIAKFAFTALALALLSVVGDVRAQTFSELRPAEQSVLKPLAGEWDSFSATRKKKWREMAVRYPTLSPDEQQRITTRMQGWSRMSPDDRRAARDQFREINKPQSAGVPKQENREELKRKWETYRELPVEKRNELAAAAKNSRATPQAEAVKRAGVPPLPPEPVRTEAIRPPPGSNAAQR